MGEIESKKNRTTTTLAPGFRFHPTDEEIVAYYLRRKVTGVPFRLDAISEIDIYKVEPSDLPGLSKLKTRDREWYFFSALDRKYGNGMRTNRATSDGYWKTTGKDRPVHHKGRVAGMKKTLVYHFGRAPRGKRTDWVMHEYKLVDEKLDKAGYPLEGFVLCRIFQKSGTGPKNGEQYGAPLVEEEWEDNEVENLINGDISFEDPYVDDDAFIEHNDLVQDLDLQFPQGVPLLESSPNYVAECKDVVGIDQMPAGASQEYECGSQAIYDQEISDLLLQVASNTDAVKNEYMPQLTDEYNEASVNLPDNNFCDPLVDDGLYVDAVDFLGPSQGNTSDAAALGSFFDNNININIEDLLDFDSPELSGTAFDQALTFEPTLDDDALWNISLPSDQLPGSSDGGHGSSSKKALEAQMDKQSSAALRKASRWLENIPAHPAYASELPSKDMASRLSAAVQASPVHVTAGMIRIRDSPLGSGLQWSVDKNGSMNVTLSFELPQTVGTSELESLFPSKLPAAVSRGWLCFMFFWVMFFALSIRIGTSIYAK
ncbi:NAC domain-containing protein 78 [Silene latifolia]|uniref:NAC domain-containing protein 78 n=1 Tax=Silene latifolia TaxID=37657 RepID=UPI003D770E2C